MKSGIYKITNIVNNKCYIGSAVNLSKRWTRHLHDLRNEKHHSSYLQRAYRKYGEASFKFEILFLCPSDDLIRLEQYHLDNYLPEYNIARIAGSNLGIIRSLEYRIKQSKSQIGKKMSKEAKLKMSAYQTGRKHSKEHVLKCSLKKYKAVVQICKTLNIIINEYSSLKEAVIMTGISHGNISAALANRTRYANGYIWKYKDNIQCQ